jgi:putative methanogen marker protein 4
MSLFDVFASMSKTKSANIGIGLGNSEKHNLKLLTTSKEFLEYYSAKIFFFGNQIAIDHIKKNKNSLKKKLEIELINSEKPEDEIFNFLNNGMIDAIVRGNLSSSSFLKNIKKSFDINQINRLALLETYNGEQFFYGPVGIDECNSIDNKIKFIQKAIKVLDSLQIIPKVSVLSGGRLGDRGRDPLVDKTINIAQEVVHYLQKLNPDLQINHDEILIENAINKQSNLIIAPDGISGNLIYRTLVHLGGGHAYGAIYMDLKKPIIDTSRVGKISEIKGAFTLALALS